MTSRFLSCFSLSVPSYTCRTSGISSSTVFIPSVQGENARFLFPFRPFYLSAASWLPEYRILSRGSSNLVVGRRDNESSAWHLMPALGQLRRLNVDSRRCHLDNFSFAPVMFSIHWSTSWSVQIENCDPSRYLFNCWTVHSTAGHSLYVVSNAFSAFLTT